MAEAADKIDFWKAVATSITLTSALAFALASIYALSFFGLLDMSMLEDIPFTFIVFSMLAAFNLTFTVTVLDQVYA